MFGPPQPGGPALPIVLIRPILAILFVIRLVYGPADLARPSRASTTRHLAAVPFKAGIKRSRRTDETTFATTQAILHVAPSQVAARDDGDGPPWRRDCGIDSHSRSRACDRASIRLREAVPNRRDASPPLRC